MAHVLQHPGCMTLTLAPDAHGHLHKVPPPLPFINEAKVRGVAGGRRNAGLGFRV